MKQSERLAHIRQLVSIPSTHDNPFALREAIDYVKQLIDTSTGVVIEEFESNGKPSLLAYRGPERPETFDIILNGHVDVVAAADELFQPRQHGDRMYGRGVLDMKASVICLVEAFNAVATTVSHHIGLQLVSDEEIGGYDGVQIQLRNGVRSKFAITAEYNNHKNTIYNAARGICWLEIAFKGKAAHSGHLWNGQNAVVRASQFAAKLLEQYPTPDTETWTTTVNIASLETGNTTFNQVPDSATLKLDVRFTQEDPSFRSRDAITAMIKSIDPEAIVVDIPVYEPSVETDVLNPYVRGLSSALASVTGQKVRYRYRPATGDVRHYAAAGTDVVEFGVLGGESHAAGEYLDTRFITPYVKTLVRFLKHPTPSHISTGSATPKSTEELIATLHGGGKQTTQPKAWFVSYGASMLQQNFDCLILGGTISDSRYEYPGCKDRTLPEKASFVSIPHRLYFAGECVVWPGGGTVFIDPNPASGSQTIAKAYLITLEQITEATQHQNMGRADETIELPFEEAIRHGHARILNTNWYYDELVFVGQKDGLPMFATSTSVRDIPEVPPTGAYLDVLCRALSEHADQTAAATIASLRRMYKSQRQPKTTPDAAHQSG